ncbi:MAG: ankyrin repeat domain-containing protein [Alphaproteobacteria bacterium]
MGMELEDDAEERKLAGQRAAHFYDLILHRHSKAVAETIKNFPDCVHWRYPDDLTPLICAVRQGHNEIAEMLLKAGAPVKDCTQTGWTAFIYAGRDNNPGAFDLLLKHGASVLERATNGDTALTQALEGKHSFAALRLIELGADIEAKNLWSCFTPLIDAAWSGDAAVCAALIRAGANLDAVEGQGMNALQLARLSARPDFNTDNQKWLDTLAVLEPAYEAKAERERLALREKLGNEMEQGTAQPVTVGHTLKLKPRVPSL